MINDNRGNILVLLDASWTIPFWPAVERFTTAGGVTYATIYDLVPVRHAETVETCLQTAYTNWVCEHLRLSGRFLTVSRTVAGELDSFLLEQTVGDKTPADWQIDHFYLGSELDLLDLEVAPRPDVEAAFAHPGHVFIMVGSIEPRKNHQFALDAFDLLWAAGCMARLVIIGRFGWKNEGILARIAAHPMLGSRLLLMRDMNDSELEYAYRQASAIVVPSEAEGFGLPVVEAIQRGLPVMCSDIPVFQEIAVDRALFFDLSDPSHLEATVSSFVEAHDPARRTERHPYHWLTWRESAAQLLHHVLPTAASDDFGRAPARSYENEKPLVHTGVAMTSI